MAKKCDVLIIGGGVVGLSTGIALLEANPSRKVVIAEKESRLGLHASGRNSGVLHSGFYYSPDSLKAKFCRDGNQELRKLAKKYNIPIREVGKVVVPNPTFPLTYKLFATVPDVICKSPAVPDAVAPIPTEPENCVVAAVDFAEPYDNR